MKNIVLLILVGAVVFACSVGAHLAVKNVQAATLHHQQQMVQVLGG